MCNAYELKSTLTTPYLEYLPITQVYFFSMLQHMLLIVCVKLADQVNMQGVIVRELSQFSARFWIKMILLQRSICIKLPSQILYMQYHLLLWPALSAVLAGIFTLDVCIYTPKKATVENKIKCP